MDFVDFFWHVFFSKRVLNIMNGADNGYFLTTDKKEGPTGRGIYFKMKGFDSRDAHLLGGHCWVKTVALCFFHGPFDLLKCTIFSSPRSPKLANLKRVVVTTIHSPFSKAEK